MPFGLQVVGRFRGDRDLLDASAALESAFNASDELRRPIPTTEALKQPVTALKSIVTDPPDDRLISN